MLADSDKLKQLRNNRKLTQDKLAEELEVSKSLIVAIENGDRNISLKLLKRFKRNSMLIYIQPAQLLLIITL